MTYFAGSGSVPGSEPVGDVISSMAIAADGNILVGGFARSSDLPGLWTTPMIVSFPASGRVYAIADPADNALPSSISGVAETAIQLVSSRPAVSVPLAVAGVRTREQNTVIWVKSAN